jgi:hypothetical protein
LAASKAKAVPIMTSSRAAGPARPPGSSDPRSVRPAEGRGARRRGVDRRRLHRVGAGCRGAVAAGLLLLPGSGQAQAPPCDARLQPITGTVGYVPRGNRCEGQYVSPVSAPGLELLSLLRGRLTYDLQSPAPLVVIAGGIEDVAPGPLHVRALARPLRTYYRMDALVPREGRLTWPLIEVLAPLRLPADKLGVFGWVETPTGRLFVPLRVVQGAAPPPGGPLELVVRSSLDVERVLWRHVIEGQPPATPTKWQPAAGSLPAGQPVAVVLPEGPRAVLRLDLVAKSPHRDEWTELTLRVLRDAP